MRYYRDFSKPPDGRENMLKRGKISNLPELMLGTSPFIGAGQFGPKSLDYRRQFFDNPDNMTRLFVHSASLGVRAVQIIGYQPLVAALMKAEEISGDFFVAVTVPRGDFASNLDLVSPLEPEFVSVHAQFCDGNDSRLNEWIDMIRDAGARPAASTHSPGSTIPLLDELAFEAYLAPVNTVGYGMEPDIESTLMALERTRKKVFAIKPLAAGKLSPEKSVFEYIYRYAD